MKEEDYSYIIVESFEPKDNRGRHGRVHVRPLPGQYPYTSDLFVECPKTMKEDYPLHTKFRIKAKITDKEGGTPYIYTNFKWPFKVIPEESVKDYLAD